MSSVDFKTAQEEMYHYAAEVRRLLKLEQPDVHKERMWGIVVSGLGFELNLAIVRILTLSYNKIQQVAIELARAVPEIYFPCILLSVGAEMLHIRAQPKPAEVDMRWEEISVNDARIRSNDYYQPGRETPEPGEYSA